jgi:hypothetical protein
MANGIGTDRPVSPLDREQIAHVEVGHTNISASLARALVIGFVAVIAVLPLIEVTHAITVNGGPFRFTEDFQGFEVIARQGTVIGHDGDRPVRTPYDECVLIMPSRRLGPGLTAVRLGRFVE